MSWLFGGSAPDTPKETALIDDPSIPGRKVEDKPANRPFLAHKKYMDRQRQLHEAWLERKKERDEKIKRGEPVGPLEHDPTGEREIGVKDLLKFLVLALIGLLFVGKFMTGSWTWDYDGKWVQLKTYWPNGNQRLFTENGLKQFDGTDPNKPIYLSIDGDVYDVSSNRRTYGPGGSYHILAGHEGGRSFGTGCFQTHRTHDLRGLNENELRGVQHWKKFFANHKEYNRVGRLLLQPIDPASPIPEHCDPKRKEQQGPKKETKESPHHPKPVEKPKDEL